MTERPIIFNSDMIRAILDGRKTQTRRPIKPQPPEKWGGKSELFALKDHCPFGVPGDRLWVKETWRLLDHDFGIPPTAWIVGYECGEEEWKNPPVKELSNCARKYGTACGEYEGTSRIKGGDKRPSIHMPRWASRILLEITDVRVERIKEITMGDCRAEGCDPDFEELVVPCPGVPICDGVHSGVKWHLNRLWDSIYAKRGFGWDSNPWVWAITFKRIGGKL